MVRLDASTKLIRGRRKIYRTSRNQMRDQTSPRTPDPVHCPVPFSVPEQLKCMCHQYLILKRNQQRVRVSACQSLPASALTSLVQSMRVSCIIASSKGVVRLHSFVTQYQQSSPSRNCSAHDHVGGGRYSKKLNAFERVWQMSWMSYYSTMPRSKGVAGSSMRERPVGGGERNTKWVVLN
jgi:hypothetical protein